MTTFLELQTAVQSRGFQYLTDTPNDLARVKRVINTAVVQVSEQQDWPFMLGTQTGAIPMALTDCRKIETVYNSTTSLSPLTRHTVLDGVTTDLTITGTAQYYYVLNGYVQSYPVTTDTFTVAYYKTAAPLVNDTDSPLMPSRWTMVVEDLAVAYLAEDGDTRNAAFANYQNGLLMMSGALMDTQLVDHQQISFASEDW